MFYLEQTALSNLIKFASLSENDSQRQSISVTKDTQETRRSQIQVLIQRLRGETPWREFAASMGDINHTAIIPWLKTGNVGEKGKRVLATFLRRSVRDVEDYLDGKYTIDQFLDPQFKLSEKINGYTEEGISAWIRYRSNLQQKVRLHRELSEQISGIALDKTTLRLQRSLQSLLSSRQYGDSSEIAEEIGLSKERIDQFLRGEALPCEDEITALAPILAQDIDELRRAYITGSHE